RGVSPRGWGPARASSPRPRGRGAANRGIASLEDSFAGGFLVGWRPRKRALLAPFACRSVRAADGGSGCSARRRGSAGGGFRSARRRPAEPTAFGLPRGQAAGGLRDPRALRGGSSGQFAVGSQGVAGGVRRN